MRIPVKNANAKKEEIISYLRSVGLLEWKIQEFINEIEQVDDERKNLFIERTYSKKDCGQLPDFIGGFFKSFFAMVGISFVFWIVLLEILSKLSTSPDGTDSLSDIIFFILICISSLALFVFLLLKSKGFVMLRQYIKDSIKELNNLSEFKKNEQQRLENAPETDNELQYKRQWLVNIVNKATYDLEQAYGMNILYHKYQNLNIVFTLYEYFMAGSVDTLKEAINKYDSESRQDEIIAKLGQLNETIYMIYSEMMHQTQLIEENNDLISQQLEYSHEIAQNTKITALNTSVLLLIEEEREFRRIYG